MKIRRVSANNKKSRLEITVYWGKSYPFPYVKLDPRPKAKAKIREIFVDKELGNEAVTYVLESGDEGAVHIDHVLEYNKDPKMLSELLSYKLTVEAQKHIESSGLSRREIARRLNTSLPQLYRLLDPTNKRKSINQLISLLHVLDCDIDLVVTEKNAA
jgi:predicted XRE-type DNA-binding protein